MSALEDQLAWQCSAALNDAGYGVESQYIREYRFSPPRMWRFDFAWPDRKIAVEVEGGIWNQGRHTRPEGYEQDCVKYSEAAILGWRVLRVTGGMIADGRALRLIERALRCE